MRVYDAIGRAAVVPVRNPNGCECSAQITGLTQFCRDPSLSSFKSFNTKMIASALARTPACARSLLQAARKSLILETERCPSG